LIVLFFFSSPLKCPRFKSDSRKVDFIRGRGVAAQGITGKTHPDEIMTSLENAPYVATSAEKIDLIDMGNTI
jgi:hypothetical protein